MESSKWIAAAASLWIQCSCGASYAFGIYSSVLKSSQGYDQSTLDTVSVFKDIGANAGILAGLLYTAPHPPPSPPWQPITWRALGSPLGGGDPVLRRTFFNTTNVVTAVHNFPDYSGTSVGIMKGILGLSGAVLIQVYQTFLKGRPSTFILMLAVLPTSVSLLLMCLVRIYPTNNSVGDDKKYLDGFSSVALIVAAYLLILIILENLLTFPLWAHILTFIVLLLLLASPLTIAIRAQEEHSRRLPQLPSNERSQLIESEKFSATEDSIEYHEKTSDDERLQLGKEMNLLQSVRTVNFWLLFIAMFCGMGSGLATVNNTSAKLENRSSTQLWRSWSLMPTITSEIFGVLHMGTIFNAIAAASPVGSYIFSVLVIGYIYDKEASGEGNSCYGTRCFMLSFFILAAVSLSGFLVALILLFRTRSFYTQLFHTHLRRVARR
ncbi:nodulin-like [Actinidia rufa]|uniref:Nodulin-like n=1 Tax=Actinidia rufa TaxID=165716 RepID=A0A7J0DD89_9ERIC|nr:nodulin-like [Actinidia rufa]